MQKSDLSQILSVLSGPPHTRLIAELVRSYIGRDDGGAGDIDVRSVLRRAEPAAVVSTARAVCEVTAAGGRVFVIGNGGSYDNARLIAKMLSSVGAVARTPGTEAGYRMSALSAGFESVFRDALEHEGFCRRDMVIGLSGSGNSPNILSAVSYAMECASSGGAPTGARVGGGSGGNDEAGGVVGWSRPAAIAMGGRDGGKLRRLVPDGATLLAATDCMEAIEDVHPLMISAVCRCIRDMAAGSEPSGEAALAAVDREVLRPLAEHEAGTVLSSLASDVARTIFGGGRIFLLGDGRRNAAVTHMEADWGRGLINQLPVKGPERRCYDNTNAWMATGNDDGHAYRLIDELARVTINDRDVVVFIGDDSDRRAFELCADHVSGRTTRKYVLGTEVPGVAARIPAVGGEQLNLTATIVMHAVTRSVHDYILSSEGVGWEVEAIDLDAWPEDICGFIRGAMGTERKLGKADTLVLEQKLRRAGLLPAGKVVTWCYGRPHMADDPTLYGLERCFY